MYCIVQYTQGSDAMVITNEDGTAMLFETYEKALKYAKKEINWNFKIVRL